MNILQINTHDVSGGAARAMYRLHQGLRQQGHNSRILARFCALVDPNVLSVADVIAGSLSSVVALADQAGRRMETHLGIPFERYPSTKHILESSLFQQAQILNLHNLHGRYFNHHLLPVLSMRKPTVWTLHDMWALTGHCAYSYDCLRWKTGCFDCPLLKEPGRSLVEPAPTRIDHTRRVWRTKRRLYQKSRLHVVAPSKWLCQFVKESILAEAASIQCIPHGLDLAAFQPRDRAMARRALDIPAEAKTILFVADRIARGRKGFHHLLDALQTIEDAESIVLLTIGSKGTVETELRRFRRRDLGPLSDERLMSLVYSAADVFAFPTLADNQPLVLMEALASGTPIVSYDVGGVPEMVRHLETGYLARYNDVGDLAKGLQLLLDDDGARSRMSRRCRAIAEAEYSLDTQVRRYRELYEFAIEYAKPPHQRGDSAQR